MLLEATKLRLPSYLQDLACSELLATAVLLFLRNPKLSLLALDPFRPNGCLGYDNSLSIHASLRFLQSTLHWSKLFQSRCIVANVGIVSMEQRIAACHELSYGKLLSPLV